MIETDRLRIQSLSYDQLLKYIQNDQSLERELQLNDPQRNALFLHQRCGSNP